MSAVPDIRPQHISVIANGSRAEKTLEAIMEIRPISGALGAEIMGVDLARDLGDAAVVAGLRQALLDHLVIFFRKQDLSPDQLLAVGRAFGEPIEYPFVAGLPDHPLVIPVIKREDERVNFGGLWHTDTAYLERPPLGSLLYALKVPACGGDTLFANQYLAYETLSDGMKTLLAPLKGVNSAGKAAVAKTRADMIRAAPKGASAETLSAIHPVVRTHPETGRRSLYVNLAHTTGFEGMTEAESTPLLDFLFRHQVREEFTCRFQWRPGSLAFWDNRCALHYPLNDYQGQRRVMQRVTLAGDKPA